MMNTNPHRALQSTNGKTFYAHPDGTYSYWFAPAHGRQHSVLKLRCSKAVMAAFRKSSEGRAQDRFADVLEIGNGWYEITSKDMTEWNAWFGTNADGTKTWLKAFNLAHVRNVDANPKFNIKRVKERVRAIDPNTLLTTKTPPLFVPTPRQVVDQQLMQRKLGALVERFGRKER